MGNAHLENKRVKKAIMEALFILMKRKAFSEISVTDIVTQAGVARASYYRNFSSMESIVDYFIEDLHQEITGSNVAQNIAGHFSRDLFVELFENAMTIVLSKKSYILSLYDNGFGGKLQYVADIYIETVAGDMSYNSVNKYILYCFSGAIINMLIHWLREGAEESPHELANACADYFLHGLLEFLPINWVVENLEGKA